MSLLSPAGNAWQGVPSVGCWHSLCSFLSHLCDRRTFQKGRRKERLVWTHHFRGFRPAMVGKAWQGLGWQEHVVMALLTFADQGQI